MSFHNAAIPEDLPPYYSSVDEESEVDENERQDEPARTPEVQDMIDAEKDLKNETRLRDKDRAGL